MALSKYLDPKNDIAFKKIFGTEKNKDILMHFLNDILGFSEDALIMDIEFLSPILPPKIAVKKQSIVDVLCKDKKGIKYIIEMQVTKSRGFEKRAQYYASQVYGNQANVGDEYHGLKEIIFIAIADCIIFPNKSHYKSDHVILDKATYEHNLKDFYFTFIELPKFNKSKEELSTIEEKWCYFFKHAHETTEAELQKVIGRDTIIHRAYTALDQFHWTERDLATYEELKRIHMDNKAAIAQQIYEMENAKTEGRAEGRTEGRVEGEAIGIEKEKMQTAKRLLQTGCGIDLIVQATNLPREQIESLKNKELFVA
ncbi:Rpn family recombination-promoting nuclease/putative transposase [Candidatus Rhabdochlamydia porcellionis]|jgi:predicted transposase/invertase (TIGR01784 family)|uniref:Transposase n=1 Tax=Candidatus Rhabdochlamydia porcellionis TaxID=225148 RepID=A0ABX8Z142_9BACT|nr:Rpn family recombination-promoting nuclease/putative transposase [Candidatus Rhabdochlamydia porcellionis]QZA58613.1 Transposase [Candidatus Rhabdochlamydia porcellionis]